MLLLSNLSLVPFYSECQIAKSVYLGDQTFKNNKREEKKNT